MYRRVVFVGDAQWLESEPLRHVRKDRRNITVGSYELAAARVDQLGKDARIVLVQLGADVEYGLSRLAELSASPARPRCIAVSRSAEEDLIRRCVELDAWGQLLECASGKDYQDVITRVNAGKLSYPPAYLDRIVTHQGWMALAPMICSTPDALLPEERSLLTLLADGLTITESARKMGLSARSTRHHQANLMKKLDG